jgi:ligand-binding sensor domain-containing protein
MKKTIIRISLVVFALLFCAVLLLIALNSIKKSIESKAEREGFDVVLEDKDICAFSFDGDILYAGGADGLYAIDIRTLEAWEIGDYSYIRALQKDAGGLFIGHDSGLTYIRDDGYTETVTTEDYLPDNRVNALLLDSLGRLWIGTWGGAVQIDGDKVTLYDTRNGLIDNMVNVIYEDSRSGIWFGSYVAPRGGISILTEGVWQYFTTGDDLPHANITAIIGTGDGRVTAGGGLYNRGGGVEFIYRNGRWEKEIIYTKESGLAGEKIRSLYIDSQKRLWAGSEYDGLAVLSGSGALILDETCGLSCYEVKIIREDKNGDIWLGTRRGVTRITKGVLENE